MVGSSRGLGSQIFILVTRIRIPYPLQRVNGVKVAHQVSEEWFPRIGLNDLEAEWVRFPLTPKNFEKIIYINIL